VSGKNMQGKNKKAFLKIIAVVWAISGIVILAGVLIPILSYRARSNADSRELISPMGLDFTKASNWFTGGVTSEAFKVPKVSYYTISIPRLKIEDAVVAIGGEDLAKNLIQYPGTALPGKNGNAVIFGHSVLPIFYNPREYISIFSTLPSLKKGDEVFIEYDNVSYTYKVEDAFEVSPTDIQVLQQDSSDSFLTLITCVPPGDPRRPKRLIVRARVVPI